MTIDETTRRRPPSGHQYAIAHGNAQAQVAQVGATLRRFTVDDRDVIDGFGVDERATDGRGQILAPWPNRLTDGRYQYNGHDCQAAINEPSRNTAIHGLVRWLDWSLVAHEPASVTLSCALRPQPGYEWQLHLEVTYALDPNGLTVTLDAVNVDEERAPFGVGFHPYLTLGMPSVDGLDLTLPATTFCAPNGPGEQLALVPVTGTPWDFTRPVRIGVTRLDTAFGGLVRGDDGRAVATVQDPDGGRALELWVHEAYRYLMVYTADDVGPPERRRRAIAIEPMTCPPDALRTGMDLTELAPGGSWRGSWGLQLLQPPAS